MISGIGFDLTRIDRIKKALGRHGNRFLSRLFASYEIEYCSERVNSYRHYAARFAAKEAFLKALGEIPPGGFKWTEVGVLSERWRPPTLVLTGSLREYAEKLGITRIHLSLTHEDDHAGAVVVLEAAEED